VHASSSAPPQPERRTYVAVALLSAGVLVLQIALNRIFS
jgi:hypothetical protein